MLHRAGVSSRLCCLLLLASIGASPDEDRTSSLSPPPAQPAVVPPHRDVKEQQIPSEYSHECAFVLLVGSPWRPSSDKKVDEQNSHSNVEQNHHDNKDRAVDLHSGERRAMSTIIIIIIILNFVLLCEDLLMH